MIFTGFSLETLDMLATYFNSSTGRLGRIGHFQTFGMPRSVCRSRFGKLSHESRSNNNLRGLFQALHEHRRYSCLEHIEAACQAAPGDDSYPLVKRQGPRWLMEESDDFLELRGFRAWDGDLPRINHRDPEFESIRESTAHWTCGDCLFVNPMVYRHATTCS